MQDVYKNIEEYNLGKERKVLIVLDDMIAVMISNKKTKSNSNWTIYYKQKIKYLNNFYYAIIF